MNATNFLGTPTFTTTSMNGDHSDDRFPSDDKTTPNSPGTPTRPRRGGITVTFPQKLHSLLEIIEKNPVMSKIVSWHSTGCSFVIHDPTRFVNEILPKYFRQTKFASFQRQLNAYHFCREGGHQHTFSHKQFIRNEPELCKQIKRAPTSRTPGTSRIGYLLEEIRRSTYSIHPQKCNLPPQATNTTPRLGEQYSSKAQRSPKHESRQVSMSNLDAVLSHSLMVGAKGTQKQAYTQPSSVADLFLSQRTLEDDSTTLKPTASASNNHLSIWDDFDLDAAASQVLELDRRPSSPGYPLGQRERETDRQSDNFWICMLQKWDPQAEEISEASHVLNVEWW